MKRALITGILGQDGIHLTKLLSDKGYKIFGLLNNKRNPTIISLLDKFPKIELIEGNLTDSKSLFQAVEFSQPDEIYNLGGISSVGSSFSNAELSMEVNGKGVLNLLEAAKYLFSHKEIKFYQASSSEMYGKAGHFPQNELTTFNPVSPYAKAKVYAHNACIRYRETFGMHISCGILFNHESEYRSEDFVTRKISKSVAKISRGELEKVRLGTLEPKRDWGYAGDYVEAMWLMLQQQNPDDYVIATGEMHSIRDFLVVAIKVAGLKGYLDDYVIIDDDFKRPVEIDLLVGDASKAKNALGWEPKVRFEDLVSRMVRHDMQS